VPVSDNGETPGDTPPGNGVPKLTVGQRVLASLPNLQRSTPPATPPSSSPTPTGRGGGSAAGKDATADVVSPDEVLAPDAPPPRTGLRDAFLKPAPQRQQRGAPSGMNKEELTHIIKRIDDREKTIALGTAGLGLIVGIALTIIAVHINPAPHHKGHTSSGFIIFEGGARVVLSAVVVLAARNGRRSFVAFALLFLGTSLGSLFALPFWAVGIWLIFRVLKWQRELAALTGSARAANTARSAGTTRAPAKTASRTGARPDAATRRREAVEQRRRARTERMNARTAGGRRSKKQPEPTGPAPNKRYTPPRPTRQRPPTP
jgi:hypothetical protein